MFKGHVRLFLYTQVIVLLGVRQVLPRVQEIAFRLLIYSAERLEHLKVSKTHEAQTCIPGVTLDANDCRLFVGCFFCHIIYVQSTQDAANQRGGESFTRKRDRAKLLRQQMNDGLDSLHEVSPYHVHEQSRDNTLFIYFFS